MLYEIKVHYWAKENSKQVLKTKKFISQHQITSKVFKLFIEDYFKTVDGFVKLDSEWGSQFTVSNELWKDPEVRKNVLAGVTEKEKCY